MMRAAIVKEVTLVARDRVALATLFVLPLVFIAVFGAIFGRAGASSAVALTVWHAPGDPRGAAIVDALGQSGTFAIRRADRAGAADAAADGGVGLIIPPDLSPAEGRPAELLLDGATPGHVRAAIEVAISAAVTGITVAPDAPPVVVVRAAPAPSGFQTAVPGYAVLFGFFLALTVALSFVEERRTGTWRRILASPASWRLLLVAKLVPYLAVGVLQFVVVFAVGVLVFQMEIAGSVVALAALGVAVVATAAALGLAIAAIGGTERQIGGVGSIGLLVAGIVGGAVVPEVVMPELLRDGRWLVPHGWALDGFHDVIVRAGTGLADVAPHLAALLAFAAAFAGFGVLAFRFDR